MMKEDFYATLKLKSGEEIFAKVLPTEEDGDILLVISNPIIVSEIKSRGNVSGYKIEPWLKTTNEDMFLLSMSDILVVSESNDLKMIRMYQTYLGKFNSSSTNSKIKLSREMGYISTVEDAKKLLEKIYNKS